MSKKAWEGPELDKANKNIWLAEYLFISQNIYK